MENKNQSNSSLSYCQFFFFGQCACAYFSELIIQGNAIKLEAPSSVVSANKEHHYTSRYRIPTLRGNRTTKQHNNKTLTITTAIHHSLQQHTLTIATTKH